MPATIQDASSLLRHKRHIATAAAPDRIVYGDEKINGSETIATSSKKIEVAAQSTDVWFRSGAWRGLGYGPVHQSG
jgi:hypothetical protein